MIDLRPLSQPFSLIEKHKIHIVFLKENGIFDDVRKADIIAKIKYISIFINQRCSGGGKKRTCPNGKDNISSSSMVK